MKGGPSGTYHAIEVWRRSDSGGGVLAHEERRRALPMKLQRPLQERQQNAAMRRTFKTQRQVKRPVQHLAEAGVAGPRFRRSAGKPPSTTRVVCVGDAGG